MVPRSYFHRKDDEDGDKLIDSKRNVDAGATDKCTEDIDSRNSSNISSGSRSLQSISNSVPKRIRGNKSKQHGPSNNDGRLSEEWIGVNHDQHLNTE
mgnify:CR=1 FL=1